MTRKDSSSKGPIPESHKLVEVEGVAGKFPAGLVEAWGEKSLAEVLKYIEDPFHDEMSDVLFNSGLSPEEQHIYLEASPEVHTLRSKLIDLETQVMAVLLPKLEKKLKRLVTHWKDKDFKVCLHDFVILFDYANSLRQFVTQGTNVRNMRVMELMTGMVMQMVFHTHVRMADWQLPAEQRAAISDILKKLFQHLAQSNGLTYLAFNLLDFANKNRIALNKTEQAAPGNLERILNQAPVLTPDELTSLILEVEDLLSARHQSFNATEQRGAFVFTPVTASEPVSRASEVAKVALILDPKQKFSAPKQVQQGGVIYGANEGALEFVVDRSINEVCLPQTHFPMSVMFENNPRTKPKATELYRKLKALVYTGLRDFLQSLPEDTPPAPVLVPQQVRQEVEEEVREVYEYVPYKKPEAEPEEAVPASDVSVPSRLRFDECTGFRGTEVLRALTRILGEPVRVSGSHHIFLSSNGTKLPIAIHGAAKVDPRALRDNVEAWGITDAWRREMGQKLN